MGQKKKDLSPLYLSLLHLLPSLLLLFLIIVGFIGLTYSDKHKAVLGVQTSQPQIRTESLEERLEKLIEIGKKTKSEAIEQAKENLSR